MTSQKKLCSNRLNAEMSTGPKTAQGKARSRYNALKTGIYAIHRPLPGEDHEAYRRLSRRLMKRYAPTDPVEELLVDQILGHIWRVGRLERAEKAYLQAIDETRCNRQSRFDVALNALISREENFTQDTSKIRLLSNAHFTFRNGHFEEEVGDNLGGALLEASISRDETQPLVGLMVQRSALLDEILWLEGKLEAQRRVSLNHFVPITDTARSRRRSIKLRCNKI